MTLRILTQVDSWADSHLTTLPSSNPFQPAFPSPTQPPPLPIRYDGMPPSPMDNFQPPPLPPKPGTSHTATLRTITTADPDSRQRVTVHVEFAIAVDLVDDRRERSRNLRIAKMKPHLQFMVGPLLRYDTIENGIWRGAALIVSECASRECVFRFLALIMVFWTLTHSRLRSFGCRLVLRPAPHTPVLLRPLPSRA
jgi:hypothetical protein